ncbi:MAG TPA: hypothetical protein VMS96_15025 [Terriglobales bacterium]|nr:hypothetical protein [Terriglobales bacterium]
MAIEEGRYLCCPLCQGKGQMHRSELIERLSDPTRREQLELLLQELKQPQENENSPVPTPNDAKDSEAFQREVYSWPPKRILWRRSPKE